MVTSDGKSQGWICVHQESVSFVFWQSLFLKQLKILRARFRLLDESKRLPSEKEKGEKDFVPVHICPLGILTFADVSFLIYRRGIIVSDFSSLIGVFQYLMK